jgi:hypothetical protein
MMFESGMLDADIDDDSVRIATRAHVRAYERLRKRQLTTPEIEAACKSVVNTDSSEEQVWISLQVASIAGFANYDIPFHFCVKSFVKYRLLMSARNSLSSWASTICGYRLAAI